MQNTRMQASTERDNMHCDLTHHYI